MSIRLPFHHPRLWWLLLPVLLCLVSPRALAGEASASVSVGATTAIRGAPPTITPPLDGHPVRFFSIPGGDVYAQMPDGTIRSIRSGRTVMSARKLATDDYSIVGMICAAAPGPRFACLVRLTKTETSGNRTTIYKKLVLLDSEDDSVTKLGSGSSDRYHIAGLGVHIDGKGSLTFAWAETVPTGNNQTKSTQYLYVDGERQEMEIGLGGIVSALANVGGGDRQDPPIQFVEFRHILWMVHRDGTELVVHPIGVEPHVVAFASLHDIRPIVTPDGWFYILYHDPRSNTARAAMSKDGSHWTDVELDGKESGWQMEAVADGESVYAVFYYFRNSYNKGLRVSALKSGKRAGSTFTLVRERDFNTGWHPKLAVATDGSVWLTYLRNVENEERVWSKFKNTSQMREYAVADGNSWEDEYKDYYLQTGVGGWMTWWNIANGTPKAEDVGGLDIGKTEYSVGRALMATANLEARYGSIDIGMSYAQEIVDDAAQKLEDSTGIATGSVKIDQVFPGHDMKLAFMWGRYRGTATIGNNVTGDPELELNTDYVDAQFLLLNKWRIKYGLAYTQYRIPAALHVFTAPEGDRSYTYEGSFFRNVGFKDYDIILGYSKLDYTAKYENYYNDIFLDGSFAFGLTMLDFPAVNTTIGEETSAVSFNIKMMARLGWLYFHRFESTGGFGIYVRPAYTAEFMTMGSSAKPDDREADKAESDSIAVRTSLTSLRHGPWLDLGVVW